MPTLRHRLTALVGALALLGTAALGFGFGGTAVAQTGYPPGTTVPPCTPGDASAGTVGVGQTIKFVLCGDFADGATITITVNGVTIGITKTATGGSVTVTVKVVSTTVIEIDDPVQVAISCGTTNTVAATGPSAAGGTATSRGTFTVLCGTTNTTTGQPLALTGANVVKALVGAAVLILVGTLLVFFVRRRRQAY